MNIAFFTPKMIVGGAEDYILAKTRWLVSYGHKVTVFSEGGENVNNLPESAAHYTANFAAPFATSTKRISQTVKNLCDIIQREKIDIIEAHNTYPAYYAYLCGYKIGIPFIYNLLNELAHTRKFHNPVNFLLKDIDNQQRFYALTSQMNIFVENQLKTKFHPTIIPIPVEPVPQITVEDHKFILSVCRFSSDKMYVLPLINGFAEAYLKGVIASDYRLKIIGDGQLYDSVAQVAEKANRKIGKQQIELLGTVTGEALFEFYAKCSLYVGMGTTILQCAQYAKPIVKVGIEPQTMPYAWGLWGDTPGDKDKICAYNEPQNNQSSFEEIISKTLVDHQLRTNAGLNSAKIIQEVYNIETILQRWNTAYQNLAVTTQINKRSLHIKTTAYNALMRLLYNVHKLVRK